MKPYQSAKTLLHNAQALIRETLTQHRDEMKPKAVEKLEKLLNRLEKIER